MNRGKYDGVNRWLDGLEASIGSGPSDEGCDRCRGWEPPPYNYEVAIASLAPKRPTRREWEAKQATTSGELPRYEALMESLSGRCAKCGRRLPDEIVIKPFDYYGTMGIDVEGVEADLVDGVLLGDDDDETVL